MTTGQAATSVDDLYHLIYSQALQAETALLDQLMAGSALDSEFRAAVTRQTESLVVSLRQEGASSFLQSFLSEYGLTTEEGVALMSMAEAFLRIPDAETLDDLIFEKVTSANWQSHSGQAASFLVNASTWGLMLTGKLLTVSQQEGLVNAMHELLRRLGEPVVRVAMTQAMERIGDHFVTGKSIDAALHRTSKDKRYDDYTFSFDMLGESALTHQDADGYFESYLAALRAVGKTTSGDPVGSSGISVKLSALHPRFELAQKPQCLRPLLDKLEQLTAIAAQHGLNLNIDGEEAERMALTLDVFGELAAADVNPGWDGLGIVVQAYSRNALPIIRWLNGLAEKNQRRFMVRLVKGAYWDTEIKRAQVLGLESYPVFTHKSHTDISYLCAAEQLLRDSPGLFPQFATHNAHTISSVLGMAEKFGIERNDFEFQRLYGMGASLHESTRRDFQSRHRIYAPVGDHEDLLAYLVRRMLENGANNSFVHQLTDARVPAQAIATDPFSLVKDSTRDNVIVMPSALFGERQNSSGYDLANPHHLEQIETLRAPGREVSWEAAPLLAVPAKTGAQRIISNPANPGDSVGVVTDCDPTDVAAAVAAASDYKTQWQASPVTERAACLNRAADLYQEHFGELCALMARETGKTLPDILGEWREAIDFLRYYAEQVSDLQGLQQRTARGVFACIAPWNFPLSIFTGQIAAALVTGNTVLAKPAEQSTLLAFRAVQLMHEAGVPRPALQLLPGTGEQVGAALTSHPDLNGVCFTGSTEVAAMIRRAMLAAQPDARLIAETGGINAMIVDSTALPEQSVRDIMSSAFSSAGQRCSALRIVYLQEEIADTFISMLIGAMDALVLGDPWELNTDVGPVIDSDARDNIQRYLDQNELLHQLKIPVSGLFVAPSLIEVASIGDIAQEVFGPVLHIARYRSDELERVIDEINAAGYGLTCALHSRLTSRVNQCIERLRIGNIYVNRDQIGAVVESQPFGGCGLSGTGPKAGGPLYLQAFTESEKTGQQITEEPALPPVSNAQVQQAIAELRKPSDAEGDLLELRRVFPNSPALAACDQPRSRLMRGPTGERNIYQLRGIGVCLCLGPGEEQALEQALQALAFGGDALLCCAAGESTQARLEKLRQAGHRIALLHGWPDEEALGTIRDLAAVSYCGTKDRSRELLNTLAYREGAQVRYITELISPADYCYECHVCNDITSAGGNTELMAMSD